MIVLQSLEIYRHSDLLMDESNGHMVVSILLHVSDAFEHRRFSFFLEMMSSLASEFPKQPGFLTHPNFYYLLLAPTMKSIIGAPITIIYQTLFRVLKPQISPLQCLP